MVECLRHVAGRAVDEVVRAELEESASLSVPRDRDGAEAEAVCELRRSRLFGQLPGRNKLKAGSRLLVSPFPEIKFILSCCGVL
jgi:hypothetical protein